jgi:uncharacterized membrane protein
MRGEARAVFCREPVVLAENVAFDLDDAPAGEARNLLPGRVGRTVDVVGSMIMMMIMRATVIMMVMIVMVTMLVIVIVIMIMVAVMVMMMSGLIMAVIMSMSMMMLTVIVMMITGFDGGLAVTAATHRAHHSTSSSLTRMSSPPVTCS